MQYNYLKKYSRIVLICTAVTILITGCTDRYSYSPAKSQPSEKPIVVPQNFNRVAEDQYYTIPNDATIQQQLNKSGPSKEPPRIE
jgi:PBP1b-binding outer membrane lipoprotein LpoB